MKRLFIYIMFSALACQTCKGQVTDSMFIVFKKQILLQQGETNCSVRLNDELRVLYYSFLDNSDINSLVKRTEDSHPAIRSLMFTGLALKNANDTTFDFIYSKHLNDTAIYKSISGCVGTDWKVNEWMKFTKKAALEGKLRKIVFKDEIKKLSARNILPSSIVLPNVRFNRIKKSDLLKLDELLCIDSNYTVSSFTLSDGKNLETIYSNKLTDGMKKIIQKTQINRMFIEGIKVRSPDHDIRRIGSISLILE